MNLRLSSINPDARSDEMIREGTMKLPRRKFLQLAASAVTLPAVSRIAAAQAYPTRPLRLVVGFPAGGVADLFARLIGQSLSERLGQHVIIENRAGAGSNLATEGVVRATPDGYTLFYATSSNSYNTALYDKLNFDFIRDITPRRGHHARAEHHGGEPISSGQDRS